VPALHRLRYVLPVQHPMHRARAYAKLRRDSRRMDSPFAFSRSILVTILSPVRGAPRRTPLARALARRPPAVATARPRHCPRDPPSSPVGRPGVAAEESHPIVSAISTLPRCRHCRVAAKRPPSRSRQSSPSYAGVVIYVLGGVSNGFVCRALGGCFAASSASRSLPSWVNTKCPLPVVAMSPIAVSSSR
jgi:hypothetical protein